MVAAAMAVQDQNRGTGSNIIVLTSSRVSPDAGTNTVKSIQVKEQLTHQDDYAPKVRKPYIITKQRERWTEEEHKKFIEALKLYGRGWRRIEEYVETKTAVQIRSHAQKFFSKVVRESNNGEESSENSIEIPPPRPKRRPLHPYPRKLALPTKISNPVAEKPESSTSTSSSLLLLEQENQSPTSVLSTIASDGQGTSGSSTPNCCPSPVSSSNRANACPDIDKETAMKLLLFSQGAGISEEKAVEISSFRCLKLFGKTVLVTDSRTPTTGISEMQLSDTTHGLKVQPLSWNFMPAKFSYEDSDCHRSAYAFGAPANLRCMQVQQDSLSNRGTSLPWLTSAEDVTFSTLRLHSPIPVMPCPLSNNKKSQGRDGQKEGSFTGSNTESVRLEGDEDKRSEIETQSWTFSLGKDVKQGKALPSEPSTTTILGHRRTSSKNNKGFLPYKRCLEDRGTRSSTITSEEMNERRIRLCL